MNPITFSTQLDYKTYIKLAFFQYYRRWQTKVIFLFFLYVLARAIFDSDSKGSILSIVIISLALIASVLSFYIRVKSAYKSTPQANQETFWKIDEMGINVTGNSLSQHWGWENIINITNSKNWVFLWHNKVHYSSFPKNKISQSDLHEIIRLMYTNQINSNN